MPSDPTRQQARAWGRAARPPGPGTGAGLPVASPPMREPAAWWGRWACSGSATAHAMCRAAVGRGAAARQAAGLPLPTPAARRPPGPEARLPAAAGVGTVGCGARAAQPVPAARHRAAGASRPPPGGWPCSYLLACRYAHPAVPRGVALRQRPARCQPCAGPAGTPAGGSGTRLGVARACGAAGTCAAAGRRPYAVRVRAPVLLGRRTPRPEATASARHGPPWRPRPAPPRGARGLRHTHGAGTVGMPLPYPPRTHGHQGHLAQPPGRPGTHPPHGHAHGEVGPGVSGGRG